MLAGYLTAEGLSRGVDAAGWYHTGDAGTLEDGWLIPTGRMDQMFISGGENIHPETIERALGGLVEAAAVVGEVTEVLPDEAACALSLVDIVLD